MTATITKITMIVDGVRVSLMKSGPDRWQWRSQDETPYSPEFVDEDRAIKWPSIHKLDPMFVNSNPGRWKSGQTLVELLLIVAFFVVLGALFFSVYQREHVLMPNAYKAWVKQTGNDKNLSYEEWKTLVDVQQRTNQQIIIAR